MRAPAYALGLAGGMVAGLAFHVDALSWLMWIAVVPLFLAIFRPGTTFKQAGTATFAWALVFNLFGQFHITKLHSLEWRGLSWGQSLFVAFGGWIVLCLLISSATALWGIALHALRPEGMVRVVYASLLWVLIELLQRVIPLATPWTTLAVSQADYSWLVQIAALTGSAGLSALIVAVNGCAAIALLDNSWRWGVAATAIVVANATGGAMILASNPERPQGVATTVRLVQGNIAPQDVWKEGSTLELLGIYEELTMANGADQATVILWPETAIPVDVSNTPLVNDALREIAKQTKATIGLGALRTVDGKPQNGFGFYAPSGEPKGWYGKRHLVPFGEYTPGGALLKPIFSLSGLSGTNTLPTDMSEGTSPGPVEAAGLQWGPIICFEVIFPNLVRNSVLGGANVLLEATNDAWFKDTQALSRHHRHGVLRAVENRRYMVRVTNTGVSGILDPYGRQIVRAPPMIRTTVSGAVWPMHELTLYSRLGDWLGVVAAAIVAAAGFARARRCRKQASPAQPV